MFWLEDFISLIYPKICACCGNSLWKHEEVICDSCRFHLPKTNFHLEKNNPVWSIFSGRVAVEYAAAYLYFNKGNKVQRMVHLLKYKGRKDIGIFLGEQYGIQLHAVPFFDDAMVIIPVPLHKKKYMKRGYNQSEKFAEGLSSAMNIPVDNQTLVRTRATETQTRKSRFKRWQNVKEIFALTEIEKFRGCHLLLVDDVITTGATIESCIQVLQKIPEVRISILSIATALL